MAYFTRYEKAITDYSQWINTLNESLYRVEQSILQNDTSDSILEKIMSISISVVSVSIGSGVIALLGFSSAGFIGVIICFAIGLLLSKGVNKKVFGTVRTLEDINEQEQSLIFNKNVLVEHFRPISKKLKISKTRRDVAFTRYHEIHELLSRFSQQMKSHNSNNLAYKYRRRHSENIQKSIQLVSKFNCIYAPKSSYRR